MNRFNRIRRDESGMTYVFIGLGLMAFLSASMLAIDVGMLMTARNQAQNSADAGALAGATALLYDDFDDRTATGPAVTNAINASLQNDVMAGNVSVTPDDVEFLPDPTGEMNRVKVTVYRRGDRGNAMTTQIAKYFGIESVGVAATATAEVSPSNAMACVKPFTIPDKWIENTNPQWDPDDTYEAYDRRGARLANADRYIPADQPGYTGYNAERDRGTRLMIRAGNGNNISPSFYFSITIGGTTGADEYRWNIANCNTTMFHWGDIMTQEPGAMMGPTVQGATDLVGQDPDAYWDNTANRVMNSRYAGRSPRVFPIPLYDPEYYASGMATGRNASLRVANWIGFFMEEVSGNNIFGRITPIAGLRDRTAGEGPAAIFPRTIRLVQ
jgi:Flp pilus assembly protein TadG